MDYIIYRDKDGKVIAQYRNCDTLNPPESAIRYVQTYPEEMPQIQIPIKIRESLDDRIRRIIAEVR